MNEEENLISLAKQSSLHWIGTFLQSFSQAQLFFVGGCVRDTLLCRATQDVDIVIGNLSAPEIERWFKTQGTINFVGKSFGVYKFIPQGSEQEIDIALPRTEHASENNHGEYKAFDIDARSDLPIEMDLARRDFTINAMAFDLRHKKLIDPHHGRRDLEAKLIKTVGAPADRFREDLSRVLRAVRFACAFGFHIEEHTWACLKEFVPHLLDRVDDHDVVAHETIGKEFLKSFLVDPLCTIARYENAGLLSILFPAVDASVAKLFLDGASGLSPKLLIALFLLAADPDEAHEILSTYHFSQLPRTERFHIDSREITWLLRSVHLVDVIHDPSLLPGSTFERLFLGERGECLLDLLRLTRADAEKKIHLIEAERKRIHALWGDEIPELITGEDLINMGLTPGPAFRKMQQAVRDAQLAGTVMTKEEAREFVKKI